jgi:threonine/homoserine/homoserine lactone efflux protein/ABC-type branched-subunit amino acid transport system substrate-binding protein
VLEIIFKGVILGLANSLSPGPLMMLIIRDSLKFGTTAGLRVAVSSFFADIPIVSISFLVGSYFISNPIARSFLFLSGCFVLMKFGYDSLKKDHFNSPRGEKSSFWNGILATLLNPHPYIFWFAVGAPWGEKALAQSTLTAVGYFFAFQVTFVGTNCILALITSYLGKGLSQKSLRKLSFITGILFLVFAVNLAYEGLTTFSFAQEMPSKKIRIGVAVPLTGSDSASSQGNLLLTGAKTALEYYSDLLKKAGLAITLVSFEYRDSTSDILKTSEKLISSDIQVAFGYTFSDHVLLIADKFQKAEIPLVTPDATANRVAKLGKFIHPTAASNYFQGLALVKLAEEISTIDNSIIVVAEDCAYCVDLGNTISETIKKHRPATDIKTVNLISTHISELELRNALSKVPVKPSVIFVPNYELPSAAIIGALAPLFPSSVFLGGDGWSMYGGQVLRKKLSAGTKSFALAHWGAKSSIESSLYFHKKIKGVNAESQASAAMAFDGMAYLVQTLLKCKSYTRQSIENCLNAGKTYDSLTGKAWLSPAGVAKPLVINQVDRKNFTYFKTLMFTEGDLSK